MNRACRLDRLGNHYACAESRPGREMIPYEVVRRVEDNLTEPIGNCAPPTVKATLPWRRLLVEHDVAYRPVNFQTSAVVINETELSEPIHKEVHSGSRGADHFCQGLLAYLGNYVLRSPFFAKAGQQQKSPGQPLLGRVEQLIDQVCLSLGVPSNDVGDKQV